uniref:Uncharacterized protein n=1 Tax=Zea mays TaxID=4577 RepID=A0A804PZ50_MAIZE
MSPLARKALRSKLHGRNRPPRRFQNQRLIPFPPDTTPPLPFLGSDAVGSRRRTLRSSLHLIPFPCSPSHDVRPPPPMFPWHTTADHGRRNHGETGCTALSIVKHGDLMVVANVDDSWVVLGIATYDDTITPSSSSST